MDFKQHFIYQADYQHWANDVLLNALDRLDEQARNAAGSLLFGSIQNSVDHLSYFHRKWLARMQGKPFAELYATRPQSAWQDIKDSLRHETRALQHWLEQQSEAGFDNAIHYQRTRNRDTQDIWTRDALTHVFTYAATERGRISATAAALGAPAPDLSYTAYRAEMGDHLAHLRGSRT